MITLILLALLLTLIQLLTPALLNSKNLDFLISNREGSVEEASIVGRTRRAGNNILESLPAFLALSLLSIMLDIDNFNLAMFWLGSRVLYYFSYMFGILYLRTILWFVSIICLIMMGISLI
ncbi:MAG: MAPEG family protein [Gammaproteobacteria bacterium]|nr:MAG: MAPEG family protein [Gammaproteobacteria bacterium]|tara:strand:+ start:309 stop:671 length:363 start_codon:yes stop_codon:yes gene_type:complete